MKYLLYTLLALVILIGISRFLVSILPAGRTFSRGKRTLFTTLFSLLLLCLVAVGYFSVYYHADDKALAAMESDETVLVSEEKDSYFFDGPGEDKAFIFIPGAKVEAKAYAPLMKELSCFGIDCFLVKTPLNFPLFSANTPDAIIAGHSYDRYILSGHSLGGVAASSYAAKHPDEVGEIVLLASYPNTALSSDQRLLLIYGDKDGCLERNAYEESRDNWPSDFEEIVITGGNHAQFGSYGEQKGDGEATITVERQLRDTVEMILLFEED